AYRNRNKSLEFLDNILLSRGRHLFVAGGGLLDRRSAGFLTAGRDGQYVFQTIVQFALDRPQSARLSLERTGLPAVKQPVFDRSFRYRQYFAFVQDTVKVTSRFTASLGLRYELFGSPFNTGAAKDMLVEFGAGATWAQRIATATLRRPSSGDQKLFGTD